MKKLGVLVIALALAACGGGPPQSVGEPPTVEVATVQVSTIEDTSDLVATLDSRQSVALRPRVSGQVAQILVKQGEEVTQGAPLLVIDPSAQEAAVQSNEAAVATARAGIASREAALQSARAALASAKSLLQAREASRLERVSSLALQRRDAQRDRELFSAGVISRRELENRINALEIAEAALKTQDQEIDAQQANVAEAEARVLQAEADRKAAEQQLQQSQANALQEKVELAFHQISAPFTGKVGDIPIKVGDFVNTTTELLTLSQNDQLEVEVAIPIARASQLQEGLLVKILDDNDKQIANGQVFFVSPTVNTQSQSVLVKAAFDNAQKQLRQDQLVRVRIVWGTRPGVKVPINAIVPQAGKNFVYVVESGRSEDGMAKTVAKQRPIELGKYVANDREVLTGLKPNEKVIVSGIQFLTDGAPIKTAQK